jgi:putative DNA methylase
MTEGNKRLIEVSFPLKEVSEDSVREKNTRFGNISTLHIWWARRPLAASRATALAALLHDDPSKREEYLQLIRDISPWEAVSKDTPQNAALLEKARKLILAANAGKRPRVLDCFAGGGAIPLEALRLGCETYALDYNPVAVLLNKAVLEFPQKFGKSQTLSDTESGDLRMEVRRTVNPLLEEVRRWGNWVLVEAQKELEQFYPKDKDGSVPVAYLWSRTLPCQNAECGTEIPLMRQTWLAVKDRKKIALRMIPNKTTRTINFEVVEGKQIDFDPDDGTVSQAHTRCPICGGTMNDEVTRRLFLEGKGGQRMVAVALYHPQLTGKKYRLACESDLEAYRAGEGCLESKRKALWAESGIDPIPDEVIPTTELRRLSVPLYGLTKFRDLFNHRQLLSLITFGSKVRDAHRAMLSDGKDSEFAKAVACYLALGVDRLADFGSVLCVLNPTGGRGVVHTFGRQALGIVWDYAEANPFNPEGAGWVTACEKNEKWIEQASATLPLGAVQAQVQQGSATDMGWKTGFFDAVLTDPPYYDSVPYSHLADFFYVWLKRCVGDLFPDLFATPLTPKSLEIVQDRPHSLSPTKKDKAFFEQTLTQAFREIHRVLKPDGIAVIVFAHKTTEAWEAIINALLNAGIFMTASWPVHTEMKGRLNAQDTASLASSIYIVCRRRSASLTGEFPSVRKEIEVRIHERLGEFWQAGIRGADFFMSAIGPAVEVFGRYEKVEKLTGEMVEVRELLSYVEKVVSEFALERILGSAELGGVDPETRFYLLWRWTYNNARMPFDEARKLATAVGTELSAMWGQGNFVSKEKDFVRVLGPKDRERDKKFISQVSFSTMVDALHRACIYWERGERKQLKEHLGQTFGANNIFWRVAQNIADVLPEGDKEKQLLQGLLNVPEARDKVVAGSGKLFTE